MNSGRKYGVIILTFARAGRVYTETTLRKLGYTGEIYFVCSDDDKQLERYKQQYGNKVFVFNKKQALVNFDIGDNFDDDRWRECAPGIHFFMNKENALNY